MFVCLFIPVLVFLFVCYGFFSFLFLGFTFPVGVRFFSFIAYVVNLVLVSGSLLLGFSPGSCCRNLPFAFLLVSVPRPALAHNGAVECVFAPAAST